MHNVGAVYCDRMLRMSGFDGEGVQSGSVLVVKSHSSVPLWSRVKGQPLYGPKVSSLLMLCDVMISTCVLFRVVLTLILLCLLSETHSMPWFQNGTVNSAPSMDLDMVTGRPTRIHLAKNTSVSDSLGVP